jgi:hypothetical protein
MILVARTTTHADGSNNRTIALKGTTSREDDDSTITFFSAAAMTLRASLSVTISPPFLIV